jgi:gamma-glutamyl:cysteine ligase YbdK (ATP-grasp superfamily)
MSNYKLFEVYGIEAEYMIVNDANLKAQTLTDFILRSKNQGEQTNEIENGVVSWSNELVSHVIELKGTKPLTNLLEGEKAFHQNVLEINHILKSKNAKLLSTAMHPWFVPEKEMNLWPYGQKEIYEQYNKIFNCTGHGWSNLQSVHINLPYQGEHEFALLHMAIRLVLPLIPRLSASSPLKEGQWSLFPSERLKIYESNQKKIPSITAHIIPEAVFNFSDYHKLYEKMYQEIDPFDPEKILQEPWLNSRGAILKEDYHCIEIRIMDIQESPIMDFAIISFVVALLKRLVNRPWVSQEKMRNLNEQLLKSVLYLFNTYDGGVVPNFYSEIFGMKDVTSEQLIQNLFAQVKSDIPERYHRPLEIILNEGNLSTRIKKKFQNGNDILQIYQDLHQKLITNEIYE